jgi:hypothetical protein
LYSSSCPLHTKREVNFGRAQQQQQLHPARILNFCRRRRRLLRRDERRPGFAEGAHRAAEEEGAVPTGAASMSSGLQKSSLLCCMMNGIWITLMYLAPLFLDRY